MDVVIDYLKYEELSDYKELIDESFGSSNDIKTFQDMYKEMNDNYSIIVAKINNKIVGSITYYKINLFTFTFQPAIEIFNVAVLEEYRRNNIATKLFNYVINYSKEHNYQSIFLTCLDTAYAARNLYENIGFKKMSSIKYSLSMENISQNNI